MFTGSRAELPLLLVLHCCAEPGNGLLDVHSLLFPSRKWARSEMLLLKESRKEAFILLSVFLVDYQLLGLGLLSPSRWHIACLVTPEAQVELHEALSSQSAPILHHCSAF